MAETRDIIIIGGGHNGLVAAFYLARAGYKPLVLERADQVGGAAITGEIAPGFRCSTLAHATGPMRQDIVADMQLEAHGVTFRRPDVSLFAPSPDGSSVTLYHDAAQSAREIAKFSTKDAENYQEFQRVLTSLGSVMAQVLALTPPDIDSPSPMDAWELLKTGNDLRKLGKKDIYRLLRWGPMAAADLVAEWFDTELLRACVAARGIFGTFLGPWSAGSALAFLLKAALDPIPVGSSIFVAGGTGALTQAMAAAAQATGVEIRTYAEVRQIVVKEGRATGVVLANGDEISAKVIISNADPKRTLLRLVDPIHLMPDFATKLQNFRMQGTVAKINLALEGLPEFTALRGQDAAAALSGRIQIGHEIDYLERAFDAAKYGEFSTKPYLEVTIPSLTDSSLAPTGKHVMSIYAQYAPFKLKAGWEGQRDALAEVAVNHLATYAPNLPGLISAHQTITPLDLERTYGMTGGQIYHGDVTLDQFFTMRPLLGHARYATPIDSLYLCGSGTHPGTGLNGGSGANAAREILRCIRK